MAISKKPFGAGVTAYTIQNKIGASVTILDLGGIIQSIIVPDKNGKLGDVALGYDSGEKYTPNPGYMGALIGRYGNRIGKGQCALNGVALQLARNSNGQHLHGGDIGFDRKFWNVVEKGGNALELTYVSADGEENYPGELSVKVTYTFSDENALSIRYEAATTKDTICNLTNHAYYNLGGEGSGKIVNNEMKINADRFTVVDKDSIPTGEQRCVCGTVFDLRNSKKISDGIFADDEQLRFTGGYDHNFMVNGEGMREAAVVYCAETGRTMTVTTNQPAIQFYAGNMLKSVVPGKCGRIYEARDGLCLETQCPPDAVNHEDFPGGFLKKGEKYDFTTTYTFGIR